MSIWVCMGMYLCVEPTSHLAVLQMKERPNEEWGVWNTWWKNKRWQQWNAMRKMHFPRLHNWSNKSRRVETTQRGVRNKCGKWKEKRVCTWTVSNAAKSNEVFSLTVWKNCCQPQKNECVHVVWGCTYKY